MTTLELFDDHLRDLHRDCPRRIVRSLGWCEDVRIELRKLVAAKGKPLGKLVLYNGGGVIVAMDNLDYLMEVCPHARPLLHPFDLTFDLTRNDPATQEPWLLLVPHLWSWHPC